MSVSVNIRNEKHQRYWKISGGVLEGRVDNVMLNIGWRGWDHIRHSSWKLSFDVMRHVNIHSSHHACSQWSSEITNIFLTRRYGNIIPFA
ncbi:hypothetical protein NPIL_656421 [Nephila pilipes]|uniref:Uncharacterized protein n=1 Tax=Nephila pilipes TaxID=299642 RepID=A0A8X6U0J9_NEPPI|nr:hypothetical protein NPIL_656421 [Nephila pilipes]